MIKDEASEWLTMASTAVAAFELSVQQKRLWSLRGKWGVLCVQAVVEGSVELDVDRLRLSLQRVMARHEILRTSFVRRPGTTVAVQAVHPRAAAEVRSRRLDEDGGRAEEKVDDLLREEWRRAAELDRPSLLELVYLASAGRGPLLLITLPTLCADTGSLLNLIGEVGHGYRAQEDGSEETIQYADFAAWQDELLAEETPEAERAREFWQAKWLSANGSLSLASESPRAQRGSLVPRRLERRLKASLSRELEAGAAKVHASLGDALLTAWLILLWHHSQAEPVEAGLLLSGRSEADLTAALGVFARCAPVSLSLAGRERFASVVRQVYEQRRDLERWQRYECGAAARSGPADGWRLPYAFEWVEAPRPWDLGGANLRLLWASTCLEPFKAKLTAVSRADGIALFLEYSADAFDELEVARLSARYLALVTALAEAPERRVAAVELLTEEERRQVLSTLGWGGVVSPASQLVHAAVEECAARNPEAVALVCGGAWLSFAEMRRRADRLCSRLMAGGVGVGARVAVHLERGAEFVVAMLAINKAGAAYLPLDTAFPLERRVAMIEGAGAEALVTTSALTQEDASLPVPRTCLDLLFDQASRQPVRLPAVPPASLIYVLFTSGSTGRPKGVAVEHREVLHYLAGVRRMLDPAARTYALVSTFAADLGNTITFTSLMAGGCLHILATEQASDPAALGDYLAAHPIDSIKIVPSHLRAVLLAAREPDALPHRQLILGGEAASWELVREVRERAPTLAILNHYGPTETTVGVTTYAVPSGAGQMATRDLPLGQPLAGVRIYLVNTELFLLPRLVPGELCVGGGSVARCYINERRQTAGRFLPDPFAEQEGSRLYRTGDLARWRADGLIEFLGRRDNQVKLRGFRVELDEVSQALCRHPGVWQAVVVVREDARGEDALTAYLVPRVGGRLSPRELREFLGRSLPFYMMPSAFVSLDRLPLTANGKLDHRALPSPGAAESEQEATGERDRPRTLVELKLTQMWEDLLQLRPLSVHANFFEIGGHSLLAVRLVVQIERWCGQRLSLATLFQRPTIRRMAEILAGQVEDDTDSPLVAIQPHGEKPPFFCVHPMGGEVLCYYGLSRALGIDQPFYGLQASPPEKSAGFRSIEELAVRYVRCVRQVQPEGPYLLGGYSFGSKVSFAMAHELRRQGQRVGLLALLDGGAPGKPAKLGKMDEAVFVAQSIREEARQAGLSFDISFSEVLSRPPDARLDYVLDEAKKQTLLPAEVDGPWTRRLLHGVEERQRAAEGYLPEPYPDPICFFRSVEEDEEFAAVLAEAGYELGDPTKGWQRFAAQPIEVIEVPGMHETLLQPPAVHALAQRLKERIELAQQAAGTLRSPPNG
jgi:amino acid adenylation domain-containing protein